MRVFHRLSAWVRRFFSEPADAAAFAILRIGTSFVLLARLWAERNALPALYGDRGLITWVISDITFGRGIPHLSSVMDLLGNRASTEHVLAVVIAVYAVALIALLCGLSTRIAAMVAWVIHLTLSASGAMSAYGVDLFGQIALFYCVVTPAGAVWSIDARRGGSSLPSAGNRILLRLIQAHVCVVYWSAGFAKAQGSEWWNGEAIWRAFMQPQFRQFDYSWMASVPLIPLLAGWGTLLIELGYSAFIWSRRTRPVWLIATVALHAGIAVMLGLYLFGAIMIVLNVAAFGSEYTTKFVTLIGHALGKARVDRAGEALVSDAAQ